MRLVRAVRPGVPGRVHRDPVPPGTGTRSKVLDVYNLDSTWCMYCGLCVEACPFDALAMSDQFELAAYDLPSLVYTGIGWPRSAGARRDRRPSTSASRREGKRRDDGRPIWVFLVLAAVTLVSRLSASSSTPQDMHAALWLGLTFFGVAGVFLLLGADFLAAAQVLVYVGAITTIIIFGIMLSAVEDCAASGDGVWQRVARVASPGAASCPLIAAGASRRSWCRRQPRAVAGAPAGPVVTTRRGSSGEALFTRFVIPFELASLLLLVALVGAIVLGRKGGKRAMTTLTPRLLAVSAAYVRPRAFTAP